MFASNKPHFNHHLFFSTGRNHPVLYDVSERSRRIRSDTGSVGTREKGGVIDLVVVPGIAFDRLGYRLGYGAGYYDRFFAQSSASQVRMGVAYPEQVVETVYPEAHDVAVHALITANNGSAQVTSQLP
jgi:5,10-methenyltetrahydrofolate synthetase